MNPDDFERQLQRQSFRPAPVEWRKEILAAAAGAATAQPPPKPTLLCALNARLSSLLWPCPQAWAGLAALWVVILAVNLSSREGKPTTAANSATHSSGTVAGLFGLWRQREIELAGLDGLFSQPMTPPPQPALPRPRSEKEEPAAMA
jgi:hypothetical protein